MTRISRIWSVKQMKLFALIIAMGLSGCSTWNSAGSLPGLESWKDERAVIKKAKNDPFPSPQQVGLK